MHEPGLEALGVLGGRADAGALGHAQHHRDLGLAAEHEAHLGGLVEELVERHADEVDEHELGNGTQASGGGAGGAADDRAFADRGVPDAFLAELIEEALGHAEAAAELANVLADDEDVLVPFHLLTHRVVERLQICLFSHSYSPFVACGK